MIPGYRYRYAPTDTDTDIPNIPHTEPITDTGFIPIPGIGTWYRYRYWYHTGYRSISKNNVLEFSKKYVNVNKVKISFLRFWLQNALSMVDHGICRIKCILMNPNIW